MLDGCRALLSIANVTTPFVFDQLLKSIRLVTEQKIFAIHSFLCIILLEVIHMMELASLTDILYVPG
jgi:hypothetical protein